MRSSLSMMPWRRAAVPAAPGGRRRWASVSVAAAAAVAVATLAACVPPPPGGGGGGASGTLPPGSALPSDATCRARVRATGEIRAVNTRFNQTAGHATPPQSTIPLATRITGNFTGTTDEIIQWVACKWGIATDIVRAQVAVESWWHQDALTGWQSDPGRCVPGHPIGADGRPGQCPDGAGLMQVGVAYVWSNTADIANSSAYNLDVGYAVWRSCYEGLETWLNTVERGRQYGAGDVWGCVGRWFSGRWYTQPGNDYIAGVQDYLNRRIWTTAEFASG